MRTITVTPDKTAHIFTSAFRSYTDKGLQGRVTLNDKIDNQYILDSIESSADFYETGTEFAIPAAWVNSDYLPAVLWLEVSQDDGANWQTVEEVRIELRPSDTAPPFEFYDPSSYYELKWTGPYGQGGTLVDTSINDDVITTNGGLITINKRGFYRFQTGLRIDGIVNGTTQPFNAYLSLGLSTNEMGEIWNSSVSVPVTQALMDMTDSISYAAIVTGGIWGQSLGAPYTPPFHTVYIPTPATFAVSSFDFLGESRPEVSISTQVNVSPLLFV